MALLKPDRSDLVLKETTLEVQLCRDRNYRQQLPILLPEHIILPQQRDDDVSTNNTHHKAHQITLPWHKREQQAAPRQQLLGAGVQGGGQT